MGINTVAYINGSYCAYFELKDLKNYAEQCIDELVDMVWKGYQSGDKILGVKKITSKSMSEGRSLSGLCSFYHWVKKGNRDIMSIIREIYKEMIQGKPYMDEISKEAEKEITELLKDEFQKNREEYEQYRDRLYSAAAIAEEAGFIKGFYFAVGLITECKQESEYTTAKF